MKKGDKIDTPRFCTVTIEDVLTTDEAYAQGYTEPTHYRNDDWSILGKSLDMYHMRFVAVKKAKIIK